MGCVSPRLLAAAKSLAALLVNGAIGMKYCTLAGWPTPVTVVCLPLADQGNSSAVASGAIPILAVAFDGSPPRVGSCAEVGRK